MIKEFRLITPKTIIPEQDFTARLEETGEAPAYPDNTILQVDGQDEVWIIRNGLRCWITTMSIFNAMGADLGFEWGDQAKNPIEKEDLEKIKEGSPIERWPEIDPLSPMKTKRIMMGVGNISDLAMIRETTGCNVVSRYAFSKMEVWWQEAFVKKCEELGMEFMFNFWDAGGDALLKEAILRWKDHPALFGWHLLTEPYIKKAGCYWTAEVQRQKYAEFRLLTGTEKPYVQDRGLWKPHLDRWTPECLDFAMFYSYPWEGHDWKVFFNRIFGTVVSLRTKPFHICPILQCFWKDAYTQPPEGGIQMQADEWEPFLESKGWGANVDKYHYAFYLWDGYGRNNIHNHPYLQKGIKRLNEGVT